MHEPPNALMAINEEFRRVEALAASQPLDPDDVEVYPLILRARDALDELADALEDQARDIGSERGLRLKLVLSSRVVPAYRVGEFGLWGRDMSASAAW